jgi:hypothetical protein
MKRSQFVAVTGAALAAQARPARAAGATIRLGSSPVEEWAIPYYATQKGFFRDAGLNVEVSNFPGGGFVTQAVLGGALDVGLTNSGSMAAAHVRGLPLYLLASGPIYTVKAPIAHLIVGKNSPINDATALAGKTIGVTTLNDMVQAAAMSWIDHRGIDSHSAKWFELRSSEMAHRCRRYRRTDVYLDQRSRQGDRVALRSREQREAVPNRRRDREQTVGRPKRRSRATPHGRAAAHRGLGRQESRRSLSDACADDEDGCRDRQLDPARHLRNEKRPRTRPARDRRDRALWIHPEAVSRSRTASTRSLSPGHPLDPSVGRAYRYRPRGRHAARVQRRAAPERHVAAAQHRRAAPERHVAPGRHVAAAQHRRAEPEPRVAPGRHVAAAQHRRAEPVRRQRDALAARLLPVGEQRRRDALAARLRAVPERG